MESELPRITVEEPEPYGYLPKPDVPTGTCRIAVESGSTVEIRYDVDREQIKYIANVRYNTYLGLGYGASMKDTDYVTWQSFANDGDPKNVTSQIESYSIANHHPDTNPTNTYETTITDHPDGLINTFVSYRDLKTSGQATYNIPLD